jgi:glycosyltransferase involved in cell wall biosynthesis
MPPKVSVILPTYNRAATIQSAVASVLAQDYLDIELLIVDDGSKDNTLDVLAQIPDQRIRILRHETNRGAAAARNTAIRAASGKYIALVDSDDQWLPGKLTRQVAVMDAHPEVGASFTAYILEVSKWDSKPEPARIYVPVSTTNWHKHLAMGCDLFPTTMLARRECFEKVGVFDETMIRHEDWDWMLRVTRFFPFMVLPEVLAHVHQDNRPLAWKVEAADLAIIEHHASDFYSYGRFYGSQAVGKRYLEIAVYYFAEGNKKKGLTYVKKTLSTNPLQRPGMYLRVLDGLLGTGLMPGIKNILRFLWKRPPSA